ncbi:hypothetical protein HBB16_15430 [Pseudonocardia sp. MCCB 268]|nr:hypothetical protein [Pseudonocardia cytotoxica]
MIFNFLNLNAGWMHRLDNLRPAAYRAPTAPARAGHGAGIRQRAAARLGRAGVWKTPVRALVFGLVGAAVILPVFYRHFVQDRGVFPDTMYGDLPASERGPTGVLVRQAGIRPFLALTPAVWRWWSSAVLYQRGVGSQPLGALRAAAPRPLPVAASSAGTLVEVRPRPVGSVERNEAPPATTLRSRMTTTSEKIIAARARAPDAQGASPSILPLARTSGSRGHAVQDRTRADDQCDPVDLGNACALKESVLRCSAGRRRPGRSTPRPARARADHRRGSHVEAPLPVAPAGCRASTSDSNRCCAR